MYRYLIRHSLPIFFIYFLVINNIFASQYAHVRSDKAIIYADQELSSPIGYISRGKRIKVGEVPRKYGTLLPVLISGKIAWIKIKDIQFIEVTDSGREALLEHKVTALEVEDKLNINNYIGIHYNTLVLGTEWEELSYAIGDEVGDRPFSISVFFDHRPPDRRYSFGLGLSYMSLQQDSLKLSAPVIDFKAMWAPIKYKYFTLDLFVGGFFSGAFKVESFYEPEDTEDFDNTGEYYGMNYGIEFKYFPNHGISIINGISFNQGIVSGLAPIPISKEDDDTIALDRFKSTNYYFGLSFKF